MLRSLLRVSVRTAKHTSSPQIKLSIPTGPSALSTRLFTSTYLTNTMSSEPKTETPSAEAQTPASASKGEVKSAGAVAGEEGEGDGKISKSAGGLPRRLRRL